MSDDPRPEIRALVGFMFSDGEMWTSSATFSLEDAEQASACGFVVLVDPADQSALARWLQIHSRSQPWTW